MLMRHDPAPMCIGRPGLEMAVYVHAFVQDADNGHCVSFDDIKDQMVTA